MEGEVYAMLKCYSQVVRETPNLQHSLNSLIERTPVQGRKRRQRWKGRRGGTFVALHQRPAWWESRLGESWNFREPPFFFFSIVPSMQILLRNPRWPNHFQRIHLLDNHLLVPDLYVLLELWQGDQELLVILVMENPPFEVPIHRCLYFLDSFAISRVHLHM